DEHYKYSPVIAVRRTASGVEIRDVYPNPFADQLQINIALTKDQFVNLRMTDLSGHQIFSRTQFCRSGSNAIFINNFAPVPKGIYLLQLITDQGSQNKTILHQ